METGLEKIEEVRQIRVKLKLQNQQSQIDAGQMQGVPYAVETDEFGNGQLAQYHTLWPEISSVCEDQIHHAIKGVSDDTSGWQLFAEEGEMKMYRREEEIDGMVMDPLKSCHVVKGCTAREMCHYFFDPKYRNDWETTLEDCQILEEITKDTLVFLQTHKRIWPANQRDALFWSHMRKIEEGIEPEAKDAWIVCNHSTDSPNYPVSSVAVSVQFSLSFLTFCLVLARKPRKMHKNLLDGNFALSNFRPTAEKWGNVNTRRPHMQNHVLRQSQSRRVGEADNLKSGLQERIPKVSQTIHRLCSRHCEVKTNQILNF